MLSWRICASCADGRTRGVCVFQLNSVQHATQRLACIETLHVAPRVCMPFSFKRLLFCVQGYCVFFERPGLHSPAQIAEQRPAVASEMLGQAICVYLALSCSLLGHSQLHPRDIVVTMLCRRTNTTWWSSPLATLHSCEATSCTRDKHAFSCWFPRAKACCPYPLLQRPKICHDRWCCIVAQCIAHCSERQRWTLVTPSKSRKI